jgi:hypothetical protein
MMRQQQRQHVRTQSVSDATAAAAATDAEPLEQYPDVMPFRFHAFGRDFDVELRKNHDLMAADYKEVTMHPDTLEILHTNEHPIHCFYTGVVVASEQAVRVAIDTCEGIRGIIEAHGESLVIYPTHS